MRRHRTTRSDTVAAAVALAVTLTAACGGGRNRNMLEVAPVVGLAQHARIGLVTFTAEGARASIESLIRLTPTKARRITKNGEEEVAARELAIGDVIRLRPGDNVPADGEIVTGQGSLNQSTITGESLPVDKKPGDEVYAGTQNLTGVLEVKVTRAGTDTTLGRVRELILAEVWKKPRCWADAAACSQHMSQIGG